jgi:hypothetical protein
MSTLIRHSDQVAPALAAERLRRIQRARRVEAGNVTEMARSLLREAREAEHTLGVRPVGESQAGRARGRAMRVGGPARRMRPQSLTKRPLAAGRA